MPSYSTSKRTNREFWQTAPQADRLLRYLQQHRRGITPAIAREVLGIQRLAARVHELKELGRKIRTIHEVDEMGRRYSRYVLR